MFPKMRADSQFSQKTIRGDGALRGKKLRKSKKVFDNSKVTDHHAIIPTGQPLPDNLSKAEQDVFNLIALRFIAAFFSRLLV